MEMKSFIAKFLAAASLIASLAFMQWAPIAVAQNAQGVINNGLCTGADLQFTDNPTGNCAGGSSATDKLKKLVRTVINLLSVVVGVVAVIMIIVGGFRYITSGGSDTGVTGAKNTILYAIIGLIIVALAQVLV